MRRRAAFVVPLLALALAAGCGESGGDGESRSKQAEETTPAEAVAAASTTTADVRTARISFDAVMEISGLAEPINFTGEGAADFGSKQSRLTLDMSEFAEAFGGQLGDAAGWRGEAVYDEDVIYMRLPALTKLLPGAKRWLKVDETTLLEQGGTQFSSPDPVAFVQLLRAAGRDVKVVGEEDVRGTSTTHYRATVDTDALPRAAPADARAELEAYARRLRAMGVETIPLEAWIDEDGVARRMRVEFNDMQAAGRRADIASTIELFDLGAPVEIALPPRDQVSDFQALLENVQQ